MRKLDWKTNKNNKGITLTALVVTIIVLLILATISIVVFTGENGIIARANKAKEEMMMQDDYFKRLMEGWSEEDNPFRHSYLVKVKDIEQIHQTAKEIEKINGVDYVDYGAGMVETLISSFKLVQKASVLVVIALAVVTTFLIVNTIKLTIYSRKREISIMRLVGASNTTIKMPFVVEGMFL